jgi:hypothetical protein
MQHGSVDDIKALSFVYGVDLPISWRDVETEDGVFDWTGPDAAFEAAADQGYFIETALQVGPASPQWIYNRKAGNKSVAVANIEMKAGHSCNGDDADGDGVQATCPFPYYLDPAYGQLFMRAIAAFASHLSTLPERVRARIVASQAMFGTTGDDGPWHGTPTDQALAISDDQWQNYTMALAPAMCSNYASAQVRVLWNKGVEQLEQLVAECPGSFIKAGMVTHGYQVNDEADNYLGKGKICHTEGFSCRGESWPFCQDGFYAAAPLWSTYTHLLWLLTFGVDFPGVAVSNLVNESYAGLYENVFNRYASSIRPPATDWVGGIIALRDGLDSSDTVRFNESYFGEARRTNADRMKKIVAFPPLKQRGAVLGDPAAATADAITSRRRKAPNDVGWRIWEGNYGNSLITMLDPAGTSVGWWHVGPPDQPYGRFARGFEHSSGRTKMGFVLNKQLWGGLPLLGTLALQLRVVYYDQGGGSFWVGFDSLFENTCNFEEEIKVGSSGRWIAFDLQIYDAAFARNCTIGNITGADLVLDSFSGDTIIHGIEIYDPARVRP